MSFVNLYRFSPLVTYHCFSPLSQKDTKKTQISTYEKGDAVANETQTANANVEGHGFMPLEESNKMFSIESILLTMTLWIKAVLETLCKCVEE